MIIYMLAAAMTVAMLIATAFGLHQEGESVRAKARKPSEGFGIRKPYRHY